LGYPVLSESDGPAGVKGFRFYFFSREEPRPHVHVQHAEGEAKFWIEPVVEVTNVSPHGFWLFVGEQELFVSFTDFSWFKDASIREISHVELPSAHHRYWPDLDIDLAVESLTHPERYPLIGQAQPNQRLQPTKARRRVVKRQGRSRLRG
jgi:hypothetical protein